MSYRHIFGNHWGLGIVAVMPEKECIRNKRSQAWWWHMPFMPALRRQKQVDCYELEDSLVYIVEFQGQPGLYSETLPQKQTQRKKCSKEELSLPSDTQIKLSYES